jgi:2-iminobutanoate/2-iminopropanoate deaminase
MTDQIVRYPASFANYSEGLSVEGPGRWIFVAGQVALGPDNKLVPGTLAEQTDLTFDHVERVLKRAGAELTDVVRITVFLTSLDDYADFSEVRSKRFGDVPPTSAVMQVAGLMLDAAIEIEAVAFVPER